MSEPKKTCGATCEVYSRVCGYFRPVANWNKGKKEEFKDRKTFKVSATLALLTLAAVLLTGCSAVESITTATAGKSLAAGSDTWGGGLEAKVATVECPVPGFELWFGRRKVWYTSIRDQKSGGAVAEVVRASNSPLELSADSSGMTAGNSAGD